MLTTAFTDGNIVMYMTGSATHFGGSPGPVF